LSTPLLITVLGSVFLLGAMLLVVARADRHRQNVQQRLQQIVAAAPGQGEPAPSLLRPRQRFGWRGFLLPANLYRRLEAALAATGNRIGVPHLAVVGSIAAAVVIGLGLRLLQLNPVVAAAIGAAAALAAATSLLRFAQARFQRQFLDAFPDALDLIGRAVRAGLPVMDAMEVAAREIRYPIGGEFRKIMDEMHVGGEIEEALQRAADCIRVPDFRFFVVAITLQRRTGGHLAETLGNLSNIIRRRKEVRLKAQALTAEARASALVLTLFPFFVGAGLCFVARPLMQSLWLDPRGRFMVGLALISLMAGSVVMRVMIKRALR
jgi:Flp pilus assembly protein TadB